MGTGKSRKIVLHGIVVAEDVKKPCWQASATRRYNYVEIDESYEDILL